MTDYHLRAYGPLALTAMALTIMIGAIAGAAYGEFPLWLATTLLIIGVCTAVCILHPWFIGRADAPLWLPKNARSWDEIVDTVAMNKRWPPVPDSVRTRVKEAAKSARSRREEVDAAVAILKGWHGAPTTIVEDDIWWYA